MTTALDRLRSLVPPPAAGGGGPRDWNAVEQDLGQPLPQDYKDLVEAYGAGGYYDHVQLLVPPPAAFDGELVRRNRSHMGTLDELWSVRRGRPAGLTADDLRLVVWADTPNSDSLNWLVRPGEPPETWPVVVLHCDLGDYETYPMTCTEFLAGLLSGEIGSEILTDQLDDENPPFLPFPIA